MQPRTIKDIDEDSNDYYSSKSETEGAMSHQQSVASLQKTLSQSKMHEIKLGLLNPKSKKESF